MGAKPSLPVHDVQLAIVAAVVVGGQAADVSSARSPASSSARPRGP